MPVSAPAVTGAAGPQWEGWWPEQVRYSPSQLARLLGLPEPTAEQAAVIGAPLEPMAVIAGAGSGKSETMAARLVWLVANGMVRPEQVLGLTFTRKAAAELGQRVRARLAGLRRAGLAAVPLAAPAPAAGAAPVAGAAQAAAEQASPLDGEPVISTYHSYAARLVGEHALREALEPSLRLVTPAVAWQIASRAVAQHAGPMDAVNWSPPQVTVAVLALASELAEHLHSPAGVREFGAWLQAASLAFPGRIPARVRRILDCQRTREQLLPIVSAYTQAKAAREVMDYGDQIALAARIAARHPETGMAERARYRVVLLDEFQDTSHAQLVLLRALFGGGHPVTAVGDPCQSIYGWRGASAGNLRRFAEQFPAVTGGTQAYGGPVHGGQAYGGGPGHGGPDHGGQAYGGGPGYGGPVHGGQAYGGGPGYGGQAYGGGPGYGGQAYGGGPGHGGPGYGGPAFGGPGYGQPPVARPARVAVLATSFRNTERVLDAAAAIQQGLREQAPMVPRLVPPPSRTGRGVVTCALLRTAADEARWVAGQIGALLHLPPGTAPDGAPWPDPAAAAARVQPSDIAVLCRKRAQFGALRAAIEERGVPVQVVGLGGLLTVPEVADIVATLRVLHDPTAGGSLVRLLTGPRWRIGPRDLVALGARARELAAPHRQPPAGQAGGTARAAPSGGAQGTAGGGQPQAAPGDPIAEAVTDLTSDPGSLVEAVDDPGDPERYSPQAYARFSALAAELRMLRGHAGRPLPDLVGEVERVLGLDIEVAAQPWRDAAAARADLDAFADAAAAFADGDEEPTLGAFLAYLNAAETEEFGLESGQLSSANAVTLTTVHAAKGLQWAAVVVPGLAAGDRAQVFPARPRVTTRWTDNARLLPFSLRGDAADLPELPDLTAESLDAFAAACADRELAEERRLAYVAVTRAAFWVACTGYWWGDSASPLGPSPFLAEIRAACEAGAGTVAHWAPPPAEDAQNPSLTEPVAESWPKAPSGPRHDAVREAALLVEGALERQPTAGGAVPGGAVPGGAVPGGAVPGGAVPGGAVPGGTVPGGRGLGRQERALAQAWARDTDLLLAELSERRGEVTASVWLPDRLSVSSLVTMAADPARLAQQIRRPMPRPPAPQARRGTAFHRWLEERFGQQRLIDPSDLLGAADDDAGDQDAAELSVLRDRFEAGEWGERWPVDVEVPFETLICGRTVRGRIDAVFGDSQGGYDVVDWKTGQPPPSQEEFWAAAVQLAAYRVAWSRLAGVPVERVRAAFYYVRHDLTLRPADLLGEAGLAALIDGIPQVG
jgi:ATP-dependent DNA helicase UvrD/PcrA